jgi:hypothetical protein
MKRNDSKRRWRPGLVLALCLALGALVLAGCGGSSGASSGSTAETSTTASAAGTGGGGSESGSTESSRAEGGKGPMGMNISSEARACLKEKGVELPEFKGGEGGPPSSGETPEGAMPEGGEAGQMPEGGEPPQGGEGGPPAGGFGGEGSEKMTKAFEECGVEMPEFKGGPGGEGGAPNTNTAAFKKQVKEYVACVRENGYELAEPDFSGEGPVFAREESESAAFKKASAQCQSLLGGPEAGSSESGTET